MANYIFFRSGKGAFIMRGQIQWLHIFLDATDFNVVSVRSVIDIHKFIFDLSTFFHLIIMCINKFFNSSGNVFHIGLNVVYNV